MPQFSPSSEMDVRDELVAALQRLERASRRLSDLSKSGSKAQFLHYAPLWERAFDEAQEARRALESVLNADK